MPTLCFSLPTVDASLLSYVGVRKLSPVLVYLVVQSHCYSCQKVFEGHSYVFFQTPDPDTGVLVSWASECTNTRGPFEWPMDNVAGSFCFILLQLS